MGAWELSRLLPAASDHRSISTGADVPAPFSSFREASRPLKESPRPRAASHCFCVPSGLHPAATLPPSRVCEFTSRLFFMQRVRVPGALS